MFYALSVASFTHWSVCPAMVRFISNVMDHEFIAVKFQID